MTVNLQTKNGGTPIDQLRAEYDRQCALFTAQPAIVQRFLEGQAKQIAQAYVERTYTVHFTLPDRVVVLEATEALAVDPSVREQRVGTLLDRFARRDVHETLRQRLSQLDQSTDKAISTSSSLVRFSSATHMVHNMLPSGRNVSYFAAEDEDIPSIPSGNVEEPESAITAVTDAIVEEENSEIERSSLQVPYVPAARRFYLPQWVAFDSQDKLIVNSTAEANAHIVSMQHFLTILFAARSLAPYMVADGEFAKKRYGMLGQLVNQGRALARYQTREIIRTIKERAKAQSLNRGLSLSLPYFDDQDLRIESYNFVIIPAGRIMFVPAFVVRAALEERAKVAQDTRFSHATRIHLMAELQMLGDAFESNIE
jgi:chaperonin cofactor prefoldin